jgi:hypothetical protein
MDVENGGHQSAISVVVIGIAQWQVVSDHHKHAYNSAVKTLAQIRLPMITPKNMPLAA